MRSHNLGFNILLKPYIGRIEISISRQTPLKTRGQILLEYGVILALVIAALVGMQLYMQRQLQARYRDAVDYTVKKIGQEAAIVPTLQYSPYYEESNITTENSSKINSSYSPGGASNTTIDYEKTLRTGRRFQLPYSE